MDKALQLKYTLPGHKGNPSYLKTYIEAIKKIKNFREQLQYYNNHINSLAFVSAAGLLVLEELPNVVDKDIIYLGPFIKEGYKFSKKKFNKKHEEIFLEERLMEINRILAGIEKCIDYKSKLNYILTERAGRIRFNAFWIQANLHSTDVSGYWREAYLTTPRVIDLYPKNSNEYEDYNLTVREHLLNSVKNPDHYEHDYESFLFENAKADLERRLPIATRPGNEVIKTEIAEIEKAFPYEGKANENDIFIKQYTQSYQSRNLNENAVFNLLSLGGTIDYSKIMLSSFDIEEIIHLEEVNKYYGYLHGLLNGNNVLNIPNEDTALNQNKTNGNSKPIKDLKRDQLGPSEWEHYNGFTESKKELYRENFKNKEDFGGLHSLLYYFTGNDYNNPNRNIVSPFKGGNQYAYKLINEVWNRLIKALEQNNEIIPVIGYWEHIQGLTIAEENREDFLKLLSVKFEDGKRIWDYKTVKVFAEEEIVRFQDWYPDDFLKFDVSYPGNTFKIPIKNRWVKFLKDAAAGEISLDNKNGFTHEKRMDATNPRTDGDTAILKLLNDCAKDYEPFRIPNILEDNYKLIPNDGRPEVVSNRFNYLTTLEAELELNAHLFNGREDKFRAIEKWVGYEMRKGSVVVRSEPLKFEPGKKVERENVLVKKEQINEDNLSVRNFDELFVDINKLGECLELLKKTDRPSINDANEFIGNSKSVFVVWFNAIKSKNGFLRIPVPNDKTVTHLINNKFPGLNLTKDGSMFRKDNKRATESYKKDFEMALSAIFTMNNKK